MRPVTPQPGFTQAQVNAILASRQFVYVDVFSVYLATGQNLYYSGGQQDVNVVPLDGSVLRLFTAHDVRLSGLKMSLKVGVNVDEQDLTISYNSSNLINGQAWGAAVAGGLLDGAIIRRDRFFAANWQSPFAGGAPMFMGRVANIDQIGRQDIKVKVKSYLVLANINMPREIMQPQCRNTLYDARCTLVQGAHSTNGTVGAGSNNITIKWTGALAVHALGVINFETGPSAGQSATVKSVVPGVSLTLVYPVPFEPDPGDNFVVSEGCDKTLTRCGVLNNTANHTGFPYVPPPMTST